MRAAACTEQGGPVWEAAGDERESWAQACMGGGHGEMGGMERQGHVEGD